MAVLHVRNIPDAVYAHAQAIAAERGLTLSALVIELMQQAAMRHMDHNRHTKALARMRRNLAKRKPGGVSAVSLIQPRATSAIVKWAANNRGRGSRCAGV